MLDDDQYIEAKRQIRAQADADVAAFFESLSQGEDTGIPPPIQIRVTEVSSDPVQFQPFAFGGEQAGTAPGGPPSQPPPDEIAWACCKPDDTCEDLTKADCDDAGGTWHPGESCDSDPDICVPKGACCNGLDCTETTEAECDDLGGIYQGDGTNCDEATCVCDCPPTVAPSSFQITVVVGGSCPFFGGTTFTGSTTLSHSLNTFVTNILTDCESENANINEDSGDVVVHYGGNDFPATGKFTVDLFQDHTDCTWTYVIHFTVNWTDGGTPFQMGWDYTSSPAGSPFGTFNVSLVPNPVFSCPGGTADMTLIVS